MKSSNLTPNPLEEPAKRSLGKSLEPNLPFLETANIIRDDHPQLPSNVFISQGTGFPRGPRIKVQTNRERGVQPENRVPITLSKNPKVMGDTGDLTAADLSYFRAFVRRNREVLLAYWNGSMQIEQVLLRLQY